MFCDMTAACRDLPKRAALARHAAIHHFASRWAREAQKAGLRPAQSREEQDRNPPVEHPMLRTHPETGEPAIYAGGFAVGVAGLAPEEAEALLDWRQWVIAGVRPLVGGSTSCSGTTAGDAPRHQYPRSCGMLTTVKGSAPPAV
jgi:hypothetical protein